MNEPQDLIFMFAQLLISQTPVTMSDRVTNLHKASERCPAGVTVEVQAGVLEPSILSQLPIAELLSGDAGNDGREPSDGEILRNRAEVDECIRINSASTCGLVSSSQSSEGTRTSMLRVAGSEALERPLCLTGEVDHAFESAQS